MSLRYEDRFKNMKYISFKEHTSAEVFAVSNPIR